MKLFDNIRVSAGQYFFKKDLAKVIRNKSVINLDEAKSIGLIYNASDEKTHLIVCDFVKYLQDEKKNVKALGYAAYNQLPHYCFPKLSYDYFIKRDLNWYFKPSTLRINDFINTEFDIIIDFSLEEVFPLLYIMALSKAKYKVGRYNEKYAAIFDFMLNVDNTVSLKDFLKEVTHYLNILNKN